MERMAIRSYGQGGGKLVALGTVAQKTCFLSLLTCLPVGLLWLHAEGPLSFFLRDQHVAAVAGLYLKWLVLALVSAAGLYPATQYLRIQVRGSRLERTYFLKCGATCDSKVLRHGFSGGSVSEVARICACVIDGAGSWAQYF